MRAIEFVTTASDISDEALVFRGERAKTFTQRCMAGGKEQPDNEGGENNGGRDGENEHAASFIATACESIPDEEFAICAWAIASAHCRIVQDEPTEM